MMKRDSKRITSRNKEVATIKSLKIIQHYDLPTLLEAIDKHLEENGYNQQESDNAEVNENKQADSQRKESKQADSQPKESHDDEAKMRERLIQRMKKQKTQTADKTPFPHVSIKREGACEEPSEKQVKAKRIMPKKTSKSGDKAKMTAIAYEEDDTKRKTKVKRMKLRRAKRNVSDKTPASDVTVDRAKGCETVAEKQENKVIKVATMADDNKLLESLIDGMNRLTIHDQVSIPEIAKVPQTPVPEVASKNRKRKLELQDVIGDQLKKLRTLVENEEKLYDSVVDGLSSYTMKEPGENSVQESSPSKKCKIEVVPVKEPATERLDEEPVKRKGIISLRHIKKASVNTATSVSAPIRACAPVKDLRKVLHGRQGLCY